VDRDAVDGLPSELDEMVPGQAQTLTHDYNETTPPRCSPHRTC
jgi:hypothetical protein